MKRTLASLLPLMALVACGDDDEPSDAPTVDMGPDLVDAAPEADGGDGEPDAFVASCLEPEDAVIVPDDPVMLEQEHCTEEEVMDVLGCAFGAPGIMMPDDCQETYGFNTPNPSDAVRNSCRTCLLGGGDSETAPAVIVAEVGGTSLGFVNGIGCRAAVLGQPECAPPLSQLVLCGQTACAFCGDEDMDACIEDALTDPDVCGMVSVPEACASILDAETATECDGETFAERFLAVGDYFCGGRPVRGG